MRVSQVFKINFNNSFKNLKSDFASKPVFKGYDSDAFEYSELPKNTIPTKSEVKAESETESDETKGYTPEQLEIYKKSKKPKEDLVKMIEYLNKTDKTAEGYFKDKHGKDFDINNFPKNHDGDPYITIEDPETKKVWEIIRDCTPFRSSWYKSIKRYSKFYGSELLDLSIKHGDSSNHSDVIIDTENAIYKLIMYEHLIYSGTYEYKNKKTNEIYTFRKISGQDYEKMKLIKYEKDGKVTEFPFKPEPAFHFGLY